MPQLVLAAGSGDMTNMVMLGERGDMGQLAGLGCSMAGKASTHISGTSVSE